MDRLEARLQRLERTNRRLLALWGLTVAAAFAIGAQVVPTSDLVRAKRIEVVDAQGIPIVTLGGSRGNLGGEVILRDSEGEKRVWLSAEPGDASLGLQGGKADDPSGTAAVRADGEGAALGLVGSKASATMAVRKEKPRIAVTDARGREAFAAPWK